MDGARNGAQDAPGGQFDAADGESARCPQGGWAGDTTAGSGPGRLSVNGMRTICPCVLLPQCVCPGAWRQVPQKVWYGRADGGGGR